MRTNGACATLLIVLVNVHKMNLRRVADVDPRALVSRMLCTIALRQTKNIHIKRDCLTWLARPNWIRREPQRSQAPTHRTSSVHYSLTIVMMQSRDTHIFFVHFSTHNESVSVSKSTAPR